MNKHELSPKVIAILAAFGLSEASSIHSVGEVYKVTEIDERDTCLDIYTNDPVAFYRVSYDTLDTSDVSDGEVAFKLGSNQMVWRFQPPVLKTPATPLDLPIKGPQFTLAELEDLESVLEYVTENEQAHCEEMEVGGNDVQNHVYARASRVQAALLRFQQ